ncbi:MAG: S-layer homology domain-containing protein [Firmicutes bacterium]|nr:S-layer homology domain-containing protein [Bacillota bacterium]
MHLHRAGRQAVRLLMICLLAPVFLGCALPARAADVGSQWNYTLIHQVTLTNYGDAPARSVTVEVPLADGDSYLYCQTVGVEYSPYPSRIVNDGAGHRVAVYQIDRLAPGETLVLTQRYALRTAQVSYSWEQIAPTGSYSDAELAELAPYLQPTADIQSDDPAVQAFVRGRVDESDSLYTRARNLFSAVNLRLDYTTAAVDQSAVATLARASGSCEGYVNLYLAALRAAGVACRQVSGYLYQPAVHLSADYIDPDSGDVYLDSLRHTWAEFYLPGLGWLPADPTFTYTFEVDGQETKFVNWSYFANVSPANRYICFRQGDTDADRIRLLSATGGQVETGFSARLTAGLDYTPFSDVDGHWAEDSVRYCVENGLFNGVSAQSFAPETSMTRAMFVTVLGRLYEKLRGPLAESGTDSGFDDVPAGSYYEKYLSWAADQGVISGYGNGRFGPNDPVTREQMATIMAAFLQVAGVGEQVSPGSPAGFADAWEISGWAEEGVAACVGCGLLSGYPDGCFYPQDQATRAQVAAILERLSRWIAGREQG